MKKFCLYTVIDIKTGYELACGFKYKDFDNSKIRYVKSCEWREKPFFLRKITEYFRTLTIKGRECVIVYWSGVRKRSFCNFAYSFEREYFLRARAYFLPEEYCKCDYLIEDLGLAL